MWGARSQLLRTTDGGATWQPLDLVDGDVRSVVDAEYLGEGAGLALVQDPDRAAVLLLETADGATWRELRAWPLAAAAAAEPVPRRRSADTVV